MSPVSDLIHRRSAILALPQLLELFPKPLSVLAELADCGGCLIDSRAAGDHVIRMYVLSDWYALVRIVNTLNHGGVRWDNFLVDKVDNLLEFGTASMPETVCLAIVAAMHHYVEGGTRVEMIISALNDHLLSSVTQQKSYSKSDRCIIEDFVAIFCQYCKDRYSDHAPGKTRSGHKTDYWQSHRFEKLLVFNTPPAGPPKLATFVMDMAAEALNDIPKLLTGFLRRSRYNPSTKSPYLAGSDSERSVLLGKVFKADLQPLCHEWRKKVLQNSGHQSRAPQTHWKQSRSQDYVPPLLCEYLAELVLLHHASLPRRGVVKFVRSVLNHQKTPNISELYQAIAISDKSILATLYGKLPKCEQSFQIMVVDHSDRSILRHTPGLSSFGSAARFVSGFLDHPGPGSSSATREIYESLAGQDDLPKWWRRYFEVGETSGLSYLGLSKRDPFARHNREGPYESRLSAWVCEKEIGNAHTVTPDQYSNAINWQNELDIIFNHTLAGFRLIKELYN